MKRTLMLRASIGLVLGAIALSGPAVAETGNTSLRSFHREVAKARAAGGYGNPVTAVPSAMAEFIGNAVEAMVGRDKDVRGIAKSEPSRETETSN